MLGGEKKGIHFVESVVSFSIFWKQFRLFSYLGKYFKRKCLTDGVEESKTNPRNEKFPRTTNPRNFKISAVRH